jgi:hypothetical protein
MAAAATLTNQEKYQIRFVVKLYKSDYISCGMALYTYTLNKQIAGWKKFLILLCDSETAKIPGVLYTG